MRPHCHSLDLHRLELRFAGTRLLDDKAVTQLARSIDQNGQIVPCTVVAESRGGPQVLVDGYRRVAALRRLGRDTTVVEAWECSLADGVMAVLARADGRAFEAIEQALQLRDLIEGLGVSQSKVAQRCGRDASWVSRRMSLVQALPEAALSAVRAGWLSSWAASRILCPLARANPEHADRLLAALTQESLPTRALALWFAHYRKSVRTVRERMVDHPGLFLEALRAQEAERDAADLRAGPERACERDLRAIKALALRLRRQLADLHPRPAFVPRAAPALRTALSALIEEIERDDEAIA